MSCYLEGSFITQSTKHAVILAGESWLAATILKILYARPEFVTFDAFQLVSLISWRPRTVKTCRLAEYSIVYIRRCSEILSCAVQFLAQPVKFLCKKSMIEKVDLSRPSCEEQEVNNHAVSRSPTSIEYESYINLCVRWFLASQRNCGSVWWVFKLKCRKCSIFFFNMWTHDSRQSNRLKIGHFVIRRIINE